MANTTELVKIKEYVISDLSKTLGLELKKKRLKLGTGNKIKQFDGVSYYSDVVIQVVNHSGLTSGGRKPSAKIKNTFGDLYFLNLTNATRKILVITDEEFYNIFKEDSNGLLGDIELLYFELPKELKEIHKKVTKEASKEMTKF